jgi:hypothetical protein
LQVFFELGINQVILQFVSHEIAHVRFVAEDVLAGEGHHIDKLSCLLRTVRRWYTTAAIAFILITGAIGLVFIGGHKNPHISASEWMPAWLVLVGFTALNLWVSPFLTVLEGCGRVGQVAKLRLMQSTCGYILLWGALALGAGLWSAVAVPLANAVFSLIWLRKQGRLCAWLIRRELTSSVAFSWRKEMLPMQWRIAVSWVSGYFIFNLFTPITFSTFGAVEAGRIGVALAVFNAVSTVGMSWVTAKSADLNMYVARDERKLLNTQFKKLLLRSTIATSLMVVGVIVARDFASYLGFSLANKLPPDNTIIPLGVVTIANCFIFSQAVYMRAHKEEPMLPVSVVTGLLTALAVYYGAHVGLPTMTWLYALVTVAVSLPWTCTLFRGYYRRPLAAG